MAFSDPAMGCRWARGGAWTTAWSVPAFPSVPRSFLSPPTAASTRACGSLRWFISPSAFMSFSAAGRRPAPPTFTSFAWPRLSCTRSTTPANSIPSTGRSIGARSWPRRCSRRCFCTLPWRFPEERPASRRHWIYSLIYLPGLTVIVLASGGHARSGRPRSC